MLLNTSFVAQAWYRLVLPFKKEGVAVFDRITKELKEIMEEKGYETLKKTSVENCTTLTSLQKEFGKSSKLFIV